MKVKAIAISSYLKEKKTVDKNLEMKIECTEIQHRKRIEKELQEINSIANGEYTFTDIDLMEMQEFLSE